MKLTKITRLNHQELLILVYLMAVKANDFSLENLIKYTKLDKEIILKSINSMKEIQLSFHFDENELDFYIKINLRLLYLKVNIEDLPLIHEYIIEWHKESMGYLIDIYKQNPGIDPKYYANKRYVPEVTQEITWTQLQAVIRNRLKKEGVSIPKLKDEWGVTDTIKKFIKAYPNLTLPEANKAIDWFLSEPFWKDKITSVIGFTKHYPKYILANKADTNRRILT